MKFFKRFDLSSVNFYSPRFSTKSHDDFLAMLKRHGFQLVTKPLKLYADHSDDHPHRKANFDVELAIDAMRIASTFDTLVLFSGDSDFVYLINTLRNLEKQVILFSRKDHVAKELFPVVSSYFDIVDFRFQLLRIAPRKPKIPRERDSAVDNSLAAAK